MRRLPGGANHHDSATFFFSFMIQIFKFFYELINLQIWRYLRSWQSFPSGKHKFPFPFLFRPQSSGNRLSTPVATGFLVPPVLSKSAAVDALWRCPNICIIWWIGRTTKLFTPWATPRWNPRKTSLKNWPLTAQTRSKTRKLNEKYFIFFQKSTRRRTKKY